MEDETRPDPSIVEKPSLRLIPEASVENTGNAAPVGEPAADFADKSSIELKTSHSSAKTHDLLKADQSSDIAALGAPPDSADYSDGTDQHDWNDLDKPFVIYVDRKQAIDKMNKRFKFIALPIFGLYFMLLLALNSWATIFWFSLYVAVLYLFMVRKLNKAVKPLMVVDKTGIRVDMMLSHCHLTWDNVKTVEPYTLIYRFVGINPKSVWKVQASFFSKVIFLLGIYGGWIYKILGQRCFAINVPEQYCHFSAEEVTEQIEKRREHFQPKGLSQIG